MDSSSESSSSHFPLLNIETVSKPFRLPPPQEALWLVFFSHGKHGKNQTFYSIVERRSYVRNIMGMSRRKFLGHSHGWLIMMEYETKDCFLLNPVTMEKIQLPTLPPEKEFPYRGHECLLSSVPKEENCVVVCGNNLEPIILFCNPGEKKWKKVEFRMSDVKFCMGKLYGITGGYKLAVLDFDADSAVRILGLPVAELSLLKQTW